MIPVIQVSFTNPAVRVDEDVPSGSTQVCLIADSASPRPYTVVVGRGPSGDNPATRKCWEVHGHRKKTTSTYSGGSLHTQEKFLPAHGH